MDVREKLVELLTGYSIDTQSDVEYVADHLVSNGVTVQEWIPATERLPDVGKNVLVYSEFDGVSVDYHGGDSFGYALVTHWMPLPQPPKGE